MRAAALAGGFAAGNFRQAALIPELHGEPDDGRAAFLQQRGYGGAVHAAADMATTHDRARVLMAWHRFAAAWRTPRWPATTAGMISSACAISSSVLVQPRLRRTLAARLGGGKPDGREDVRRIGRAGRARRAGRTGEALQIERDHQRFAFDAGKQHVACVRRARRGAAVHASVRDALEQALLQDGRAMRRCARPLRPDARAPVPRPCRIRRCREHFPCPRGGRARCARRASAAPGARPCARKARRRPWGRKSCARKARADARRACATSTGTLPADCTASV